MEIKNRNNKGFTIVEMLITLAIFGFILVLVSNVLRYSFRNLREEENKVNYRYNAKRAVSIIDNEIEKTKKIYINNGGGKLVFENNVIYCTKNIGYKNLHTIINVEPRLNNNNIDAKLWYYSNVNTGVAELRNDANEILATNINGVSVVDDKDEVLKIIIETGKSDEGIDTFEKIIKK